VWYIQYSAYDRLIFMLMSARFDLSWYKSDRRDVHLDVRDRSVEIWADHRTLVIIS